MDSKSPLPWADFVLETELTFYFSSNILTTVFAGSDARITNMGFYALYSAIQQNERESGGYPNADFKVRSTKSLSLREERCFCKSDLWVPPVLLTSE